MNEFNTILITGATGYLGKALIPYLIDKYNPKSIRLFARNDWRMAELLRNYNELYKYSLLRPMIGDICDRERIMSVVNGCDLVIHCAALKRLEIANYAPQECVKVNVMGSINVMDACLQKNVTKAIFISSDKAVNAVNLYGRTKAVMESIVLERAKMVGADNPTMCIVRYGNVIGSTGAVIPYFIDRAKKGLSLPLTNPSMTRFIVTRKIALHTIGMAIEKGKQASLVLPENLKATSILNVISWIKDITKSKSEVELIGMFDGEKIHEEITKGETSEKAQHLTKAEFIEILLEEGLIND